jgi:ABC-type transport system involved in cytochrome bd biosynthesis fused ATPase/permease subunit
MPTARRPAVFGRRFARALWRLIRIYWTLPDAKRSALLLAGAIEHLSPYEQQRVALARVPLNEPEWVSLDMATSELDEAMEKRVYELLVEKLPCSALISVVHREALEAYRTRRWRVAPHPHAPATLEAA